MVFFLSFQNTKPTRTITVHPSLECLSHWRVDWCTYGLLLYEYYVYLY